MCPVWIVAVMFPFGPTQTYRSRGKCPPSKIADTTRLEGSVSNLDARGQLASRHPSSPQRVAVHDGPRTARHVVQRAALHQCVDARFAEQDERSPIVIAARITGDLPALFEELADGQRRLVGGHTGRCEHRCKENA
jgi:hypothetical protein